MQQLDSRAHTPTPPTITLSQILTYLHSDPQTAIHDIEISARLGRGLDRSGQNRAKWLLQNQRFLSWFDSATSQLLLVENNEENSGRTSSLSFFAAMLLQSLRPSQSAFPITLNYFCGIHTQELSTGPCRMIRSLVAQLLSRQPYDLGFLAGQVQNLLNHDAGYLWGLFKYLVTSLPFAIIFCVVDGISWYQDENEVLYSIQELRNLVKAPSGNVIVKVLLTGPAPRRAREIIHERNDQLLIPVDVDGDGDALTERQMSAQRLTRPRSNLYLQEPQQSVRSRFSSPSLSTLASRGGF